MSLKDRKFRKYDVLVYAYASWWTFNMSVVNFISMALITHPALCKTAVSPSTMEITAVLHLAIDIRLIDQRAGGCFTNVSWALQNDLAKIYDARNHSYGENFKLKLYTCAQSMALGTCTKFQLEILIRIMTSAIHKFRENILESLRNVSETPPRSYLPMKFATTGLCDIKVQAHVLSMVSRSQPVREDITFIMSSLIGWDFSQP